MLVTTRCYLLEESLKGAIVKDKESYKIYTQVWKDTYADLARQIRTTVIASRIIKRCKNSFEQPMVGEELLIEEARMIRHEWACMFHHEKTIAVLKQASKKLLALRMVSKQEAARLYGLAKQVSINH